MKKRKTKPRKTGVIGKCEHCGGETRRIQARVEGKLACERCYSRHRYHNVPGIKERHLKYVRDYIERNKEKVYAYNREYIKEWLKRNKEDA